MSFNAPAHAVPISGSFTTASISSGPFQYDSSSPFTLRDGDTFVYTPPFASYVSFTYEGISLISQISRILVDPMFPDGRLGYRDTVTLEFGDFSALELWHTPAGSLPSYDLADLDLSAFAEGEFIFSGFIGSNLVTIDEPLGPYSDVSEPAPISLLILGFIGLTFALRKKLSWTN
jgi:hypothetical protein